ncbi:hypothetical protein LSAT2_029396 [Lamellibrachia satsuma]|nr:hypothetical protein LSAT2_029396 [Lamellibrachia satsuma]
MSMVMAKLEKALRSRTTSPNDCSIACNPAKNHCERVCPDWPDCQSTTLPSAPTTQMSTTSPQWPWIVVLVLVVLLVSILAGAYCFWKCCGGGRNRIDEETSSAGPLMPPHCVAAFPQCDPTKGPTEGNVVGRQQLRYGFVFIVP